VLQYREMSDQATGQIVGQNIAAAMREQGLTDDAVAKQLDTHEKTVRRWRNGEVVPSMKTNMPQLAALLGHPIAWFFAEHTERAAA
jgi:transcriptional regulator with XRE-family HTH domain